MSLNYGADARGCADACGCVCLRMRADVRMRGSGCFLRMRADVRMRGSGCFLRMRADAFGADSADLCGCGVICQLILQPREKLIMINNPPPLWNTFWGEGGGVYHDSFQCFLICFFKR